jgi:hypothetical protein
LRLVYLACDCPLDLAPDEAHYWDWSRRLDWSYYSKGPLVAYLIRLGCLFAGGWSQGLTGSDMLAVRLPALVCGSLLLVSLYVLTTQVFRREGLALAVVAMALTLPVIAVGATLMTIDAPYTCCWGWALVLGYQAVFRESRWAWPLLGLVIGLGVLAKYTMILWVPSVGLFLLVTPAYRDRLWRPGFWIMAGIVALCCTPIVIWNAQHGWVTLRHAGGHAGLQPGAAGLHALGPIRYLALQFLLLLGFWFLAWLCALFTYRPWKTPRPETAYLWWMSLPIFVFFMAFSLKNGGGEPNWPIAAYVSGLVLTGAWLADQLRAPRLWHRTLTAGWLVLFCSLGLGLTVLLHESQLIHPLLAQVSGPPTPEQPAPLRRLDPTCRLRGWRTLATELDRLRRDLHERGIDVVLAGTGWNLPGEVGFYCSGQPRVYSIGLPLGDRHSQYDLWRPNPVADVEAFLGRTFIVVGGSAEVLGPAFAAVESPRIVVHEEAGQPIASWTIVIAHGFRGFSDMTTAHSRAW